MRAKELLAAFYLFVTVQTQAQTSSTSKGAPSDGLIENASALPSEGPGFKHNPRRPNSGSRFATQEVIDALMRAAAVVDKELPGGMLYINDIALEHGGPIPHHASHQSGRDVDVLFYMFDKKGRPIPSVGTFINAKGIGWNFNDLKIPKDDVMLKLDVARTWRFLQALAEDPNAHLQRIFIAEHLRTLLLEHAEKIKAPKTAIDIIYNSTCQPENPHDDHFHLRFYCTPEDIKLGCQDTPPIYPWHEQYLKSMNTEVVMYIPPKRAVRHPSKKPLAKRFPGWHKRAIEAMLERDTWLEKPHPGRPFCK